MRPRVDRIALGLLALAYGCTTAAPATPPPKPPPDAGATVATTKLRFDVDPGLACAGGSGICVAPSQVVTFSLDGLAGTQVSLSLQGDYEDAALTAQDVSLAGSPVSVTLESASTNATFTIVARVGGAGSSQSVSLPVTVSQSGTATIDATPSYAGHRPTPEVYATEFALSTCAEITAAPPDAGTLTWASGAPGAAIPLTVPAGERVAVNVRIGHYAFGCADVDPLVPQATSVVSVQVYDIPMALSLTNLDAVLSFAPGGSSTPRWQEVAGAAIGRVEAAFFSSPDDGKTLLDAMRAAIVAPADQSQFDALRKAGGWDATAKGWVTARPPSVMKRAAVWLNAAASAEIGPLVLHLGNESNDETTAPVNAVSFGALTWVAAGIAQPAPFEWTADANDIVHLSGAIDLATTPLFAHQADAQAAATVTGVTDVPSEIASADGIDCAGLASSLVGTGVSYGSCTAACTASLCGAGLALAWHQASGPAAGGADALHVTITASAPASVGDQAEPSNVQGGWLGSVSGAGIQPDAGVDASPFQVNGTLLATEPAP